MMIMAVAGNCHLVASSVEIAEPKNNSFFMNKYFKAWWKGELTSPLCSSLFTCRGWVISSFLIFWSILCRKEENWHFQDCIFSDGIWAGETWCRSGFVGKRWDDTSPLCLQVQILPAFCFSIQIILCHNWSPPTFSLSILTQCPKFHE